MRKDPMLVERINNDFLTEWYCLPPSTRATYRVTCDEWNEDGTVRRIYEIQIVDPGMTLS